MYCSNCGFKNEGNIYCTNCGNKLNNTNNNNLDTNKDGNGLRIASIVLGALSILCSLILIFFSSGFVMSIVGFILGLIANKKRKNVLGIVLNIIGFILSIIVFGLFVWFILWINEYDTENSEEYRTDNYYDYNEQFDYGDYFDDYFNDMFGEYYDRDNYQNKGEYY